jgi:purine-binding chemotaxis protein CheW
MSFYDHFSDDDRDVLRARAERIASTQNAANQGDTLSALLIRVGGESYALPLYALTAVYQEHPVVPVPCVPPFIAGIANIRGQILPVLDLATLLGVPNEAEKRALVVASNAEISIGLCAEVVGEVTALPAHTLQPVPTVLNRAYVESIAADGTALLNVDAILNDPSLMVDEAIS